MASKSSTKPYVSSIADSVRGEAAYEVLGRATALEQKGKNIVHLEIGQPDFPTPKKIVDAAICSLKKGQTTYAPTLGVMDFREKLAKKEIEKGKSGIEVESIAVMPSAKTAIFIAMASVLEFGDEVIYPDPGFPTYQNVTEYLGCVTRPLPIVEKNDFSFDRHAFENLISDKTKLIILNSPSNPTGGVIPKKDLEFVAKMAKKHNCWVISDEIYDELGYTGERIPSVYNENGMPERTIVINGFSKTYAMAGWRLGYLVVPPILLNAVEKLSVNLFACTATFTQYAGIEALGLKDEVEDMQKEYQERRDMVVETLNKIPGVTCLVPKGAFYVFPNIKSFGVTSKELAEFLLVDYGVALLPGTAFGIYGEGYLRISYATSTKLLKEGLERIKNGLAKFGKS